MSDSTADALEDVSAGFEFMATMQLRTPLAVLRKHGQKHPGPPSKLPVVCDQADGCWIPKTKSFAELGLGDVLRELPESKVASLLGPIYPSAYVPFLIAFRKVIESDMGDADKLEALNALPDRSPEFAAFWERHSESDDFPDAWLWVHLYEIKGVGGALARSLYDAGYATADAVAAASQADLVLVPGIGNATAVRIKKEAAKVVAQSQSSS